MTFASTPWWPSAWTSVSAVRSSACCGCFSVARERRRRLGSGRTYAACSVAGGSKRESTAVSCVGSSFHSGSSVSWSTRTGMAGGASETTSGYSTAPSTGGASGTDSYDGSTTETGAGRGIARRASAARAPAAFAAVAERRRSAPSDAPVRSTRPTVKANEPRMIVPEAPSSRSKPPSSAPPSSPPLFAPSRIRSPAEAITSPTRNGRKSTRPERPTISPPTATSASGSTIRAPPISQSRPFVTREPTAPPSQPSQRTTTRKSPSATRPSPMSSG